MKKKILCALLAACMVLGMVCLPGPATAYADDPPSQDKLEEARAKAAELKEQLEAAQAKTQSALDQKYLLDQRNAVLMEQIDLLNVQISETQGRISDNEAQEAEQYELFCRQVRREEERGSISYWSVLFKAKSFTDLLSRLDFVNEIMGYKQSILRNLRAVRARLTTERDTLQQQQAELVSVQEELAGEIQAANALVQEYSAQAGSIEAMYNAEAAAAAEIEAAIRAYNEEQERLRREEEERQQQEQPVSEGDYAWPTNDTRLITSPMGYRDPWVTDYIGTTMHEGVDIGASYGTNILASKSGTVILARWYGGLGYCVIIQHGQAGYYTTYGHMSRILVYEGQEVSQGQVIGLVGNTGASWGAHIHFEIHEAGVLKNPLDYLTGWIAAW